MKFSGKNDKDSEQHIFFELNWKIKLLFRK
jgi:hypothetical protein